MSFYQARQFDDEADARMPVIRSVGRPPSGPGLTAAGADWRGRARLPRSWGATSALVTGGFPQLGRVVGRHGRPSIRVDRRCDTEAVTK